MSCAISQVSAIGPPFDPVAPLIGAGIAGYLFKSGILAADDVTPDRGGTRSDVAPAPRKRK